MSSNGNVPFCLGDTNGRMVHFSGIDGFVVFTSFGFLVIFGFLLAFFFDALTCFT